MNQPAVEFTIKELALATGATARQIQDWTRLNLLQPDVRPGPKHNPSGRTLIFSPADAAITRFILRMRSVGAAFEKIAPILRYGRDRLLAGVRAAAWATYVDRALEPCGPRLRIFQEDRQVLAFARDFPGPFALLDLWRFGSRPKYTAPDLLSDPAFAVDPYLGIVVLSPPLPHGARPSLPDFGIPRPNPEPGNVISLVPPAAAEREPRFVEPHCTMCAIPVGGEHRPKCPLQGLVTLDCDFRSAADLRAGIGDPPPDPNCPNCEGYGRRDLSGVSERCGCVAAGPADSLEINADVRPAELRCTMCKVPVGGQHRPSCYRQGLVTITSDLRTAGTGDPPKRPDPPPEPTSEPGSEQ